MHKRIVEQTISDRKIKQNIQIYIWIDLFAYMYMHICPTLSMTTRGTNLDTYHQTTIPISSLSSL